MNKTITKELLLLEDLGMKYTSHTKKYKARYGLYKCFCGNEFETQIQGINNGNTKSCGCMGTNNKHNLRSHRLYHIWFDMVRRCNNPKRKNYKNYGGRGITVCNEWLSIENFIDDMYPSYIEGLSIDRIDVNGNYEKDNCRWATNLLQSQNKRLIQSNNKSGYRGVSWRKKSNKWNSAIVINSKQIHLGLFTDKIEAAKTYDKYIIDNSLEHTRNFNI